MALHKRAGQEYIQKLFLFVTKINEIHEIQSQCPLILLSPLFQPPDQDQQNGKQTLSVTATFELGKGVLIKRNK